MTNKDNLIYVVTYGNDLEDYAFQHESDAVEFLLAIQREQHEDHFGKTMVDDDQLLMYADMEGFKITPVVLQ